MKTVSEIMLTLLLVSTLTWAFNIQLAKSESTTIIIPDDYEKIQWAIGNASAGDTIFVKAETYYEHVTIDKSLTLVGENPETTIIDGNGTGNVVTVTASNVIISNLTIQRSGSEWPNSGISLNSVSNCNITRNNIKSNGDGISLRYSSNNSIYGNSITNNNNGIDIYNLSNNNSIYGNSITTNNYDGIVLDASSNNNRTFGNNITANNWDGIVLRHSSNNSIFGNSIIANNYDGIVLYDSSYSRISGNNITNNNFGIELDYSSNNRIYHNSLSDNIFQVNSYNSINIWDDGYPSGGNYWSDYSTRYPDVRDEYQGENQDIPGIDGIWDHPYEIDADNIDNYPLVEPWSPLPRTLGELETKIEEFGLEGEIDNQGIVKSLIAKLNVAQKLVDKGKIDEAKTILVDDFVPQVQNLSGIHITPEAADILIKSAEYIRSHL